MAIILFIITVSSKCAANRVTLFAVCKNGCGTQDNKIGNVLMFVAIYTQLYNNVMILILLLYRICGLEVLFQMVLE